MIKSKLSEQFQAALLSVCQQAESEVGVKLTRLMQTIDKRGGVETAQEILRRGHYSDGFDALEKAGRLDLSLEAVVIQETFGHLFTDDEVNACYAALLEGGYYG